METKFKELTEKQNNVLDFIKKFTATHGYPPSIREIGKGLNLSSPATVHTHVKNLCKAGYLKVDNNKFRAMEILVDNEYEEKNEELVKVPLLPPLPPLLQTQTGVKALSCAFHQCQGCHPI